MKKTIAASALLASVLASTAFAAEGPVGYTHFSLLKSIEAGLGLPCLNHACDANLATMSDMFGGTP